VKERLRMIDAEYGFHLSDEEMDRISKEAQEAEALFQQINKIDVTGKAPFVKLALKGVKR
jgi:Asp-tRNA(Asn)/Glu-tRNA(Gln) amidotransferase C subunit